eukprot:2109883-Pyramimonas_sp.AAC.1
MISPAAALLCRDRGSTARGLARSMCPLRSPLRAATHHSATAATAARDRVDAGPRNTRRGSPRE